MQCVKLQNIAVNWLRPKVYGWDLNPCLHCMTNDHAISQRIVLSILVR